MADRTAHTVPEPKGASGEAPTLVQDRGILIAQIVSMALIWVFVIGIAWWILNLIQLSVELDDAPGATVAISLVAIPVFFTLAAILTYVFIGMQTDQKHPTAEDD